MDSTHMSREERVKALLQQRRQSFGLTQPNQPSQSGSQQEDAAARARPVTSSKHDRIQQLLIQRRMAQQGATASTMAATVGDSSDGDSAGEGELLSPGSSMSSMVYEAADLGATVLPAHNGSSRDRSNSEASSGSAMILRGGGGAPAGTGMATIEEETPGAVQDSPLKSTSQQQQWQRQLSPPRGFQGLLQQQLAEQTSLQGNKSSEWQSGIGSLSQGLGHMVEEALAEPYAEDQADSPQQTQGQGHSSLGVADNFSFGHNPGVARGSPIFAAGQPQQLHEGSSSSSSGGKRQRLETGAEGDSASVSSHSHGAGSRGYPYAGQQGGSSGSYSMSAGSGQGGSSNSAGGSSGDTEESGGGVGAGGPQQTKKGARAGDLRSLEERMAQAMHQITLGQGAGDGPFDISDLWAASSVQSASQSDTASVQHTIGSVAEEGGATSKQAHSPRALSSAGTAPSSSRARAASPTPSTSTSDVRQQLAQIQQQIRMHHEEVAAAKQLQNTVEEDSHGGPSVQSEPAASSPSQSWGGGLQGGQEHIMLQPDEEQQHVQRGGSVPHRGVQGTALNPPQPQQHVQQQQRQQQGIPLGAQQSKHSQPSNPTCSDAHKLGGAGGGRGRAQEGGRPTSRHRLSQAAQPAHPAASGGRRDRSEQGMASTLQNKLYGPSSSAGDGEGPVEWHPKGGGGGRSAVTPRGTRDRVPARPTAAPATAFGRCVPKERPSSAPHVRRGSGSGCGSDVGASPEFTFKPEMNEMSRSITEMSYPKDRETRMMMLALPKAVRMRKYEQMRKEVEEQKLRECTFQPKLSSRPPSPCAVRPNSQEVPVHDRLYQKKLAWEEKREKLLQEREVAQLEGCTFQPCINNTANGKQRPSSTGRAPLHKRVAEVLRNKNEHLSRARISLEDQEAVNFKPLINPRSLQMMAHKHSKYQNLEGIQPGERLHYEAMEAKQRARAVDFGADAACTFAPCINDRSRALLETSGELPIAFLQRQQYLAALAAEKKAVYRSLVEGGDCTFTPRLNLAGSRRDSGSWNSEDWDNTSDRLTKLAYQDVRHGQALKEALREHHYAQYSFAPDINPRSRAMGKSHTVEDLYSNEKGARERARASQAVLERHQEDCTFKPSLDHNSLALANQRRQMGAPSLLDRLDQDTSTKMHNARLQELRAQREYEELRECTFTPEVNKGPPPMPEPSANIPGLSRYAELQELAKRKKEEEQRRQEEVWRQHPKGNPQLFTVPKPFNLETEQREQQGSPHYASLHHFKSNSKFQDAPHAKVNTRKDAEASKARSLMRILQQNEAVGFVEEEEEEEEKEKEEARQGELIT